MSAAEKFVEERNREIRLNTAEADSIEAQITINERWAVDQENLITEHRQKLREVGKLTETGIDDEIGKMIETFEAGAQKRINERINKHVIEFDQSFELPEQDAAVTMALIQTYNGMDEDDRSVMFREARTGASVEGCELALALLRGPKMLTKLSDDARSAMTEMFLSEADRIKAGRGKDIRQRASAAINTFEQIQKRLRQ